MTDIQVFTVNIGVYTQVNTAVIVLTSTCCCVPVFVHVVVVYPLEAEQQDQKDQQDHRDQVQDDPEQLIFQLDGERWMVS